MLAELGNQGQPIMGSHKGSLHSKHGVVRGWVGAMWQVEWTTFLFPLQIREPTPCISRHTFPTYPGRSAHATAITQCQVSMPPWAGHSLMEQAPFIMSGNELGASRHHSKGGFILQTELKSSSFAKVSGGGQ